MRVEDATVKAKYFWSRLFILKQVSSGHESSNRSINHVISDWNLSYLSLSTICRRQVHENGLQYVKYRKSPRILSGKVPTSSEARLVLYLLYLIHDMST